MNTSEKFEKIVSNNMELARKFTEDKGNFILFNFRNDCFKSMDRYLESLKKIECKNSINRLIDKVYIMDCSRGNCENNMFDQDYYIVEPAGHKYLFKGYDTLEEAYVGMMKLSHREEEFINYIKDNK